ncbi:MAG: DUF3109 family protein [Bacteroidales bacterium]|nr:DUF3109 family protein [Bacteroidales bacterium]
MIPIDNTIVSDNLFENLFVCNLSECKGICCIEGEAGAPLEEEEVSIIQDIFEKVKPYMTKRGIEEIVKNGVFSYDENGELGTALINGKECAFVYIESGISKCSIEKAYKEKKINFQKPISCHLFPVRIKKYKKYDAVNFEKWHICKSAHAHGKKLNIPVFKFLKKPLIRKYGKEWFEELEKEFEKIKIATDSQINLRI